MEKTITPTIKHQKRYSISKILTLIKEREAKGCTIESFCEEHQLSRSSFNRWLRKYGGKRPVKKVSEKFVPLNVTALRPDKVDVLFAEVGGIKLYQRVEAAYLKALNS
jgi:hypothetical protein